MQATQHALSWLLDRVIRSAEGHELASPSVEFGPVILTAVASAALRELHSGTRGMPKKIIWAAMSCRPSEASSWQATLFDEGPFSEGEPVPFAIPEHIAKVVIEDVPGNDASVAGEAMLSQVRISQGPAISSLPPTANLYLRRAVMDLPEPHGTIRIAWLLGANEGLIETEEGRADSTLVQAERIVSDRIIHGLGTYKAVTTVLASIDDGFRESLQSSRTAFGLMKFLDDLEQDLDGSGKQLAPVISEPSELRVEEVSEPRVVFSFDSEVLKSCIRTKLEELYGSLDRDAQIKVANKGYLRTAHGEWNAFAEFSHGFGRLRSKVALIEVCSTRGSFENALAKYFSLGTSSRENVQLLIVLSGSEVELVERHIKTWKDTGVHFAILR